MRTWSPTVFGSVVLAILLCLPALRVNAQQFDRNVEAGGVAYSTFVEPGEPTIRVLVVGPGGGVYDIGLGTRLDELLALTGISSLSTTMPQEYRRVDVKLYRGEGAQRTVIYEATAEEMIEEPGIYPALQEGDVFVIQGVTRARFTWRDAFRVVSGVSSVIFLITRIQRL